MNHLKTKITISILTFAIGVSAVALWLIAFKPDPNIYPVEYGELMRESKKYDGKIVEVQASYAEGCEGTYLINSISEKDILVRCLLGDETCDRVFDSLNESLEKQEKITVVGRYHDSVYKHFSGYIHAIEILEVMPKDSLQPIK